MAASRREEVLHFYGVGQYVVGVRGCLNIVRVRRRCFSRLVNRAMASYFNITNVTGDNTSRKLQSLLFGHGGCPSGNINIHTSNNSLVVSLRVVIACNIGVKAVISSVAGGIECAIRRSANLNIGGIGIFISKVGRW